MVTIGQLIQDRYRILDSVGEGGMSQVFRAEDVRAGNREVAVKILKAGCTSNRLEDLIRFRGEADIVSRLEHPGIVRILDFGELEDEQYLVTEFVSGHDLQHLLSDGQVLPEDVLPLLLELTSILEFVHRHAIVHRDLKPGNILVQQTERHPLGGVKLIDFGLAQMYEFSRRTEEAEVIGTFAYMSPEQSGALKCRIDERADLYSLGVIFYQLLTLRLPFTGRDVGQLIHQHAAQAPKPPSALARGISPVLERMVLKLLEKEPEQRYQSAEGLRKDLERYAEGKREFELGRDDRVVRLNYRARIVGREPELERLKAMIDAARQGRGGACIIQGEAGQGKTRLVEELRDYTLLAGGEFIEGKCFAGENKIPFGPFKDALLVFAKHARELNPSDYGALQTRLAETVGSLGEIVRRFSPALETLLPSGPELVTMDAEKENDRFLFIISRLFLNLTGAGRCLVLLLDDLQWMDEGSYQLLKTLDRDLEKFPLVILGTARPTDGQANLPLERLQLSTQALPVLRLDPLDEQRTEELVRALLHEPQRDLEGLPSFVLEKGKGNPFFAIEIVKQLVREQAVVRNEEGWTVVPEVLDRTQIPERMLDLVMKRIEQLDAEERRVWSFAAAIGKTFELSVLASICGLSLETLVPWVDRAADWQLVESKERGSFAFAHDRIQEAFCSLLPPDELRRLHREIVVACERIYAGNLTPVMFDLAYHAIAADDPDAIIRYALPAGRMALAGYSHEEARGYLQAVLTRLARTGEDPEPAFADTWLECSRLIADIDIVRGHYEEAIQRYRTVLPRLSSKLDQARAYQKICHAFTKIGNWHEGEKVMRDGLALLGEWLPLSRAGVVARILGELLTRVWHRVCPWLVRRQENPHGEKYKLIAWYYDYAAWIYVLSDVTKFVASMLRMMNLSERHIGPSRELGMAMTAYASLYMALGLCQTSLGLHGRARAIRESLGDEWGVAQSDQLAGYAHTWKGDYDSACASFAESIERFRKIGDIREQGMSLNGFHYASFHAGRYAEARPGDEDYADMAVQSREYLGMCFAWVNLSHYYEKDGRWRPAVRWALKAYRLSQRHEIWYGHCLACISLGALCLEKRLTVKARRFLEKAQDLDRRNNFLKQYTTPLYILLAESQLQFLRQAGETILPRDRKRGLRRLRAACRTALLKTMMWPTHYGSALRVSAAAAAWDGRTRRAGQYYRASIRHCVRFHRRYEAALGYRAYGAFLAQNGRADEAAVNEEKARELFRSLKIAVAESSQPKGGTKTESHVGEVPPATGTALASRRRTETSRKDTASVEPSRPASNIERLRERQRFQTVVHLTQRISSILEREHLLREAVQLVVQATGAQQGFLFMENETGRALQLQAQAAVDHVAPDTSTVSRSILDRAITSGETVLTTCAFEDPQYYEFHSVAAQKLKSILCAPIQNQGRIRGACYLENALARSAFSEDDRDLVSVLMTQLAISIENAQLYEMAVFDSLTHLLIRRHFMYLFEKEVQRAARYQRALSVLMLDLDHFKAVNDRHGHLAGDQVLKTVAERIQEDCRSMDLSCRYGGEEILLVLPETAVVNGGLVAERIRATVAEEPVTLKTGQQLVTLPVSLSIGVAGFPEHGHDIQSLIHSADTALYQSKRQGRNRVTVFSPAD